MAFAEIKNACDVLSVCAAVGSLTLHLPTIAALASLVWTAIRIVEWAAKKVKAYRQRTRGKPSTVEVVD